MKQTILAQVGPIGHGEVYDDENYQDKIEANAFYDLLEKEIIPLFYERDELGIPRGWLQKMKNAIRLNCPQFNTARMLRDYGTRGYFSTSDRYFTMIENKYQPAKDLAHWKQYLFEHWYNMRIESIEFSEETDIQVNQSVKVSAKIDLAGLQSEDVQLELYSGSVNDKGDIVDGTSVIMNYQGLTEDNYSLYTGEVLYRSSGLQGLSLRVLPKHKNLASLYEPGLILWAQ